MSIENEFGFIGWCEEDNHDKVWGYFYRPTPNARSWENKAHGWNCCIFWARRGRAMQFKTDVTGYELDKLVQTKLRKGYDKITQPKLFEIWPSFITEAEGKLMWEVLSGKIK
jgi:hypothetical protein